VLETDRTTTLDPQARLAVLLATTGLTQLDLAKLLGVASRTVRRWMQGVCTPPAVAIKELEALALWAASRVSGRRKADTFRPASPS
jgi:transcriptional regulator with XRE-family HTH domain